MFVVGLLIGAIAGFVIGALVYRNNSKKADQVVTTAQAVASDVKEVAADVKKV